MQIAECSMWAALLALALCAVSTEAREISVPKHHATIQAAIDAAADDDTIIVAEGTYTEKLKIAGKKLTLASTDYFRNADDWRVVEKTILDGGPDGKKKGAPIVEVKQGAELKLIGFTIQNSHHAVVVSGRIDASHNRFVENGDALSFEDGRGHVSQNIFENNSDDGIDMDGSSAAVIERNVIRNNKDDGIEIRLHKYRGPPLEIVIRNNTFQGNREDGLQLIDYPGMSDRTFRIERNLFADNAMAAIGTMADGNTKENYEGADMLEPVAIVNNTLVGNRYGITGGDNMLLLNNVIAQTAQSALKRVHGDSAAGVNLLWKNGEDLDNCDLSGEAFVAADPKLDAHYKPMAGSPCIDAGAARFKYNGEEFVVPEDSYTGNAPDLGAFEFKR
ncbi:MAG TPA: right-handed parallel beta-helix repeat-containing protein [Pirellulales bacterium]|nr:right-handed parallel beta-helix repeat-containing protein [Pirellulales bacterium]